ncbi:MAG: TaqI-like C-terminal specificity domain-containing protein [Anaerolineales bacterium]|nr:TaqI-like C-terminal specificity domain-containing protein [Anaerolineales bacterium]
MISQDITLNKSDIQSLSSQEAVLAFFTRLGYSTANHLAQTPAAMGFTADALVHEIRSIERIADEEGELQVYLIELKHLTIAITQALARALKNRAGNFLLVLTVDYERLDFVLLEPVLPERARSGIGAPQVYLRPRMLTVNRRNPTTVDLRVLRRFSYTEIDPLYQWDKLRSAYSVAEWSEPFFNNRALFSDYYLNERLPALPEWQEDIRPAYQALQALYSDIRQRHARQPEAELRRELFEPVFQALGWRWEVKKPPEDDSAQPDYSLITPAGGEIPCLTYTWDRFLDGPDEGRDPATPRENPGQTAVGVLDRLDGNGWVVMTNGKLWRLYSARAHSRATNYYEIDLEETLASPDPGQAFRYFWLFFRSASFSPLQQVGEGERAKLAEGVRACFLDRLLDESASYAKALGERLKNRVFEQVFPHFAEGFIHHWRKTEGKTQFSDDELAQVFQGTLTFLYRLLFLLYAEARDLLPAREVRDYYDVSLQRMKEEIAQKAGAVLEEAQAKLSETYRSDSTALYDALTRLCRAVDRGDPALNVPVYNGGLFITFDGEPPALTEDDPPELRNAVFLARHKIPDRFLALGLDRLARDLDEKTFSLAMIDYKSLGVRQLGSIYEGLLEFKVRIAAEKMAIVSGKKGDEIVPYAQAVKQGVKIKASGRGSARQEQTIPKGAVYLTNDRRERKATGSYYTPDYIVKYIVQHTVGPALEAKCETARPLIREAQQAYRKAVERQQAFQKQGMAGDDPEKVAHSYRRVVDELFDLRVLDPAMGSGHFLVEAVDFITDRLLTFLSAFPWNPVTAALRQTRQTILEEMQRQGVNVDPARLTDVHLLKRHVLKRCIYGVDLNPMAVELAKVSLWLDCFTLGAPLSFLDHHLKCGNSLIGARIEEVRAALDMAAEKDRLEIPLLAGMMGSQFAGVMLATDLMRRVGELSDVTAEQVRESRAEYRRASDALAPYKRILDLYTSRWFGNPDTKLTSPVLDFLRNPKAEVWLKNPAEGRSGLKPDEQKLAETALKTAREKRFFHWELEFPEVFFGPGKASAQQIEMKENPGFNAVIGNPPYIRVELLSNEIKNYLSAVYSEIAKGRPDLYIFFAYRGTVLLQRGGFISLITPGKFTTREHGLELRKYWVTKSRIRNLVDLAKCASVFPDATVYPCIFVVERREPANDTKTVVAVAELDAPEQLLKQKSLKPMFSNNLGFGYSVDQKELAIPPDFSFNLQAKPINRLLLTKLRYVSEELENLCDTRQGIIAGNVNNYVISNDHIPELNPIAQRLVKPVISGKHIQRYGALESDQFIIYDVKNLVAPRERGIFERPKFVMQDMSDRMEASLDFNNYYCMDTTTLGFVRNSLEYELGYILAILNSRITQFFMNESFSGAQIRGGYLRFRPQFVEKIPIRRIAFDTPVEKRNQLLRQARSLMVNSNETELLSFVTDRINAEPEESDVVHDLLAFLAEQMIEMNKQKQAEMKRFLGWLEGVLRIQPDKKGNTGLDALTGKSRLRSYLGDYQKGEAELPFDELRDILFRNRTRLGVSLNEARFMAKLQEEYEKSLAVLLPIKEKLRWTDELIDQIVYRLYGLTEEEIAIVEGRK